MGVPSQSNDSTSRSLLQRAVAKDPAAWYRMSQVYGPLVYQWCRQFGLQPEDAADVVQEVFHSLAQNLGNFRQRTNSDSFRGWLWTVTRNKLRDHWRRRERWPQGKGGSQDEMQQVPELAPEDEDDSSRSMVRAELANRALRLMQSDFENSTWQAFWKTVVEQKSASEAARELGISVASVYMAKSRVLRKLRMELAGLDVFD